MLPHITSTSILSFLFLIFKFLSVGIEFKSGRNKTVEMISLKEKQIGVGSILKDRVDFIHL